MLEEARTLRIGAPDEFILGETLAHNVVNPDTGEILANANRVFLATGDQWDDSRINAIITIEGMGFLKRDVEKTITWLYDQGVRIS